MVEEVKQANGNAWDWPRTVKLRKKIQGGDGNEVDELKFREPTAADIERCGDPVSVDYLSAEPKMIYNEKNMTAMMALLAAVPPSSIRMMNTKDYENAKFMLTGPFVPDI